MIREKFIDKLRKKYQTGGVSDSAAMASKKLIGEGLKTGLTRAAAATSGIGSTILGGLSKVIAPVGVASTLYSMYKSGQKHSGGKFGYKQNPEYVEGSNQSKFIKTNPFLSTRKFGEGGEAYNASDSYGTDPEILDNDNITNNSGGGNGGMYSPGITGSMPTPNPLLQKAGNFYLDKIGMPILQYGSKMLGTGDITTAIDRFDSNKTGLAGAADSAGKFFGGVAQSQLTRGITSGLGNAGKNFGMSFLNSKAPQSFGKRVAGAFGFQKGGMYDQVQMMQKGGLSKKVIKNYEDLGISQDILNQLNTTPSDTVLSVRNHPDLGASSQYLQQEAMFSGIPMEEKATQVYKGDKGYTRYSKFKKQTGGTRLPGGEMQPIPGSDAVQFNGQSHDQGGIMLDNQTEVENGETMDKVTMAKKGGKKKDYFFSSYLKKGGESFADMHKDILQKGGSQKDINMLAKMQEVAAKRDPSKIQTAKLGGIVKYQTGGLKEPVKPVMSDFRTENNSLNLRAFHKARKQYKKDLAAYNEDQTNESEKIEVTSEFPITLPNGTVLTEDQYNELNKDDVDYTEEDIQKDLAKITAEKQEEDRVNNAPEAKKADVISRAKDLKKRAKELNLDLNAYQGPGGGLLPSKLDSLESAVIEGESNFESLKTTADDLGIEYNDKTSINELQAQVDDASLKTQRKGESFLPGTEGIPENQPAVTIGGKQYFLDDPKLQQYMQEQGENFDQTWMDNVDPEVLEAAGITSFSDLQDTKKVRAYQIAYNTKNPDNQISVDGKLGEETLNTGIPKSSDEGILLNEVEKSGGTAARLPMRNAELLPTDTDSNLQIAPQAGPASVSPDRFEEAAKANNLPLTTPEEYEKAESKLEYNDETDEWQLKREEDMLSIPMIQAQPLAAVEEDLTPMQADSAPTEGYDRRVMQEGRPEPYNAAVPWQAWAGMGAGLIPAAFSLFHKQPPAKEATYTSGFLNPIVAERGKAPTLERFDYNQDIANVGSEVRGMNKYIETSGGGPANMINKMMAFSEGQTAKSKIRAAETRANVGVQNTEAQLEQQMSLDNMKRAQSASIFNAQMSRAEVARMDQVNEANTQRKQKRQDDMQYQKYAGMTALGQSLQQGFGDILDYKADMAKARAIGSGSNEFEKNTMYVMAGWKFDKKLGRWVPPSQFQAGE